jgi:murein DD-endopeptidase MepM/ murein hydrolase activator NlpD
MKTKSAISLLILFFITFYLHAQTNESIDREGENEYMREINSANPCITSDQYLILENNIRHNTVLINHELKSVNQTTLLDWPLREKAGFTDCSYYFISAHVDQDTASGTFHDYNCGTITYDGHKGTDIAISPFPFYKMDNDQVEVIAAAAGTIIDKNDGEFDKNCVGAGSNLTANYIIIQHADGSYALYWHMKKNSLTTKIIGQSVVSGEFLGVVGSSGNSSGPHLHFEVWSGSTSATVNDPFAGTCNLLNASTWWNVQKPYTEPAVLKASVHITDVVLPACPATETPNESTQYTIPFQGPGLSPGYAKFYIFIRNETAGTHVDMSILNPNSTAFSSWTHNCSTTYTGSYWGYSKLLPTIPGTYTFKADYNGVICTQDFEIIGSTGISSAENTLIHMNIFPNPSASSALIKFNAIVQDGELQIFNAYGNNIRTLKITEKDEIILKFDDLPAGIYFIRLLKSDETISTSRFVLAK